MQSLLGLILVFFRPLRSDWFGIIASAIIFLNNFLRLFFRSSERLELCDCPSLCLMKMSIAFSGGVWYNNIVSIGIRVHLVINLQEVGYGI